MDVAPKPRLFDVVRAVFGRHLYGLETGKAYLFRMRGFIQMNTGRLPFD